MKTKNNKNNQYDHLFDTSYFQYGIDKKIENNKIQELDNHDIIFNNLIDYRYFLYQIQKSGLIVDNGRISLNNKLIAIYGINKDYDQNDQSYKNFYFIKMILSDCKIIVNCSKHGNYILNLYDFCIDNHYQINCDYCNQPLKITEIIKKGSVK